MKFVSGAGVAEEKMVSTSEIDCTEWQSHGENKFTDVIKGRRSNMFICGSKMAYNGIGDRRLLQLAISYSLTRLFVWLLVFPMVLFGASE